MFTNSVLIVVNGAVVIAIVLIIEVALMGRGDALPSFHGRMGDRFSFGCIGR